MGWTIGEMIVDYMRLKRVTEMANHTWIFAGNGKDSKTGQDTAFFTCTNCWLTTVRTIVAYNPSTECGKEKQR